MVSRAWFVTVRSQTFTMEKSTEIKNCGVGEVAAADQT